MENADDLNTVIMAQEEDDILFVRQAEELGNQLISLSPDGFRRKEKGLSHRGALSPAA